MEQDRKITYTVKHPGRLAVVLVASVAIILLALAWALFLGRMTNRVVDLSAYTTLTRTGDTVTAVLDVEGLLTELDLPDPRTEPKAASNRVVKALLDMKLGLEFTEEADVMTVTAEVNEGLLQRRGIGLKERTWTSQVKVLPRSAQEEGTVAAQEAQKPQTVLSDGYLTALLDEEGKGLNLRKVCERVHFERDRLAKEIFGSSYATKRLGTWFVIFPEDSEHKNCYRVAYVLQETGTQEGRSVGECYFTVDLWDLAYRAGTGVEFARSEAALYDTEAEAMDLFAEFAGCTVTELIGGSVQGPERPSFDYNGFVRFVGLPMSHPLPDGSLWSPSYDLMDEDDLWRLVDNGTYTMAEFLAWVRMEIYARHGYTFPNPDQTVYRTHFDGCDWYSPTEDAPEQYFTATERRNWNLLLGLEALLDS